MWPVTAREKNCHSDRLSWMVWVLLVLCGPLPNAFALGTDAGADIQNTATVSFAINGTAQTPVDSNTVVTTVDELIDVVVVDDNGGPVGVSSPESGAILQFTVTNNGNGSEIFRIIADPNISEGGFDPVLDQIYLESNGLPGLQIGADTAYVSGSGDPLLAEDESLTVYVVADVPGGFSQGDDGDVTLRAIADTIITQAGVDDPDTAGWPVPGTSYAGFGDGGGNAVVGSSHDPGNLLVRTTGRYEVADAVVSVNKTVVSILDPFGGTTLVPGSIVTYQIDITVAGSGDADNLVISDVLATELEYVANSLQVGGAAEDDDFAPSGVDNSGFDSAATSIVVDQGTVAGGSPAIVINFQAAVR
ncbi:MAG: hypothetical protein RIC89_06445 [Pseudomonadales bacterium]